MFGVSAEVRIGDKSQFVIPVRIRETAQVGPGDILIMTSDRNGRMSLIKKPEDWAKAAWGCCKGAWGDQPLNDLKKEREDAWV